MLIEITDAINEKTMVRISGGMNIPVKESVKEIAEKVGTVQ